ncbi:glycerate kinase [Planococcus salinus]|uniref:Glycerate kinase n=1 Tax=Planococcus salinus TaxID=1848460 RepID=A0A3M8P607_9BACL|nr:glycerate kinase [Planococcus salinus]RNF39113.1 glycerate kinase [Planococcus salinus]
MKVVLAPDSFKGSLTARQAAEAMAAGVAQYDDTIETVLLPAADGGEGTLDSLVQSTNGKIVETVVRGPLGEEVLAKYGVLGDGETCIIELAEASGLTLVKGTEKNPLRASTFGTGQLIGHALDAGYRKFIVGLGGSATNDAGMGILTALGMKFLREDGTVLPEGAASLSELHRIDCSGFDTRIAQSDFVIASDVDNPLVGKHGASAVFGPQKGASPGMVDRLDAALTVFADVTERQTGVSLHSKKGAGAAGGCGGAFQVFFPSQLRRGIDVVLEAMDFERRIEGADLVITGEGKSDVQTLSGKTPFGIAEVCKGKGIPVILLSGAVDGKSIKALSNIFLDIHSAAEEGMSEAESMQHAFPLVRRKAAVAMDRYQKHHLQYRH